jgi:hypothetical protein
MRSEPPAPNSSAPSQRSRPPWTDVATAIGTLVAVAVALWLGVSAQIDQRDLKSDQREAQARRIAGWIEHEPRTKGGPAEIVMVVTNGSDLPAFNVLPNVLNPQSGEVYGAGSFQVLAPGETRRLPLFPGQYKPTGGDFAMLVVRFQDAEGRVWERDSRGALRLESETPDPRMYPPGDSPISPEGR